MRYVDRYNREHYRRLWVRRETFERLSKVCDKPIVDCVDEIVGLLEIPDRMFSKVREYILREASTSKHIKYAGGDWYIKEDLIDVAVRVPLKKATFVEVFGGSGVLSQFVPRSKFHNVIYNDIDKDLVALHDMIKKNPDLMVSILYMLPYSRYINRYLIDRFSNKEFGDLIGAAVLFYLLVSGFSGKVSAGISVTKKPDASAASRYMSSLASIYEVSERLRDVTIECLDFESLIGKYDSEDTLFYLDPPYVSINTDRSDYYRHGFLHSDALRLSKVLRSIKGFFMLKIHEDNEKFYSQLNIVSKVSITRKSFMEFRTGEERRTFRYLVLTNYRIGGLTVK